MLLEYRGIFSTDEVESTSLANDITFVKPWKSLAVALTDLNRRCQKKPQHQSTAYGCSQITKVGYQLIDIQRFFALNLAPTTSNLAL